MCPSSGEEKETHTLLVPLERAILNHVTLPEDGNRARFRNAVFSNNAT
jgi:hypothetical protein